MDADFKKPYEYEEEKRGFILLFIIMIIVLDPLQILSFISQAYDAFKQISILQIGFIVLGTFTLLYTLLTVFVCFTLNKYMIILSKIYLVVRVVFMTGSIMILHFNTIKIKNLVGNSADQYKSVNDMIVGELVVPIALELLLSVVWYLYFIKSKRCREFLKNHNK